MASAFHSVVQEKLSEFYEQGVPDVFLRDVSLGEPLVPARANLVKVLVGVRRCGKTYRLYQEMHRILDAGKSLRSILYFNFDDERLKPYDASVLDDVVETYYAMNPWAKSEGAYFFFDEIQEIPDWGTFMRRMVDTQVATIYVTGSSSKMLSSQIASEFRGRALSREIFPMSFSEFVRFHGYGAGQLGGLGDEGGATSEVRAKLRHALSRYLTEGGFIAAQNLEPSDATQLLQEYANRTVNYDVMERYNVGNPRAASLFLARCLASSGRELSLTKAYNDFKSRRVSIGREALSRLLSYYEESYLLFSVKSYGVALADNPRSSAKGYAADPSLFGAFSPAPASDKGQRLETAVFNKLLREKPSVRQGAISRAFVGEGSQRQEIDFVVGDAMALERVKLVQVSCSLADPSTRKREMRALEAAMPQFDTEEAWIVTMDEGEEVQTPAGCIHIVPAWEWL